PPIPLSRQSHVHHTFSLHCSGHHPHLHSFPTRRSSDLDPVGEISELREQPSGIKVGRMRVPLGVIGIVYESRPNVTADAAALCLDRKSTRLNSSHLGISYAVFCLKKKT